MNEPTRKRVFEPARFAFDGQEVWIPWRTPDKPRQGARCTVACAAGNHARIVNERLGVDRWFRVEDLLVEVAP